MTFCHLTDFSPSHPNKIRIYERSLEMVFNFSFSNFQVFYGREESLVKIKNYMFDENEKALVLYGEGGCGKTSLLAKTASLTNSDWFADVKPLCVIRFLGTTPDSSALTPTLISICQQVSGRPKLHFSLRG